MLRFIFGCAAMTVAVFAGSFGFVWALGLLSQLGSFGRFVGVCLLVGVLSWAIGLIGAYYGRSNS